MFSTLLLSFITCVCIICAFRFINKPHKSPICGVYQQKNKYYYVKFVFMFLVLTARKIRNYVKRRLVVESGESDDGAIKVHNDDIELEEMYKLGDFPMAVDAVYFNGVSKSGAAIICGLARRQEGVCNSFLYLKVEGGELLLSPKLPDSKLLQTTDELESYSVEGIKIRKVMPMRSWNVSYSGDMKLRSDPEKTVKVDFSLTWSGVYWRAFNFDTDMSPLRKAKDLAREPWSREYFDILERYNQIHYEQMGLIEGTVTLDGVNHKLSMPCIRDHTRGRIRDWNNFHRYVLHFIYLENGDCIAVGSVCKPILLSHVIIGYYCRKSDNAVMAVHSSSFLLYQHGENEILPKDYGFDFKAGCKTYNVQVQVKDEDMLYIGKERDAKLYERWCSYEVNGIKGWGAAEWQYKNLEKIN